MSDLNKEHLNDILSNCFWAGYLIDLPKDQAWKLANGIVDEIKFALTQANEANKQPDTEALVLNSVSKVKDFICPTCNKLAPITKVISIGSANE